MKKLLVLVALFTIMCATNVNAQQNGGNFDPAVALQKAKERTTPQLIEKVKLTEAQANKVVEINFEARQQMRGLRDLSEDDRKKKIDEVQADTNKKYKAIPLTDDQIKAVSDFYEEMRKNMQRPNGNK